MDHLSMVHIKTNFMRPQDEDLLLGRLSQVLVFWESLLIIG